MSYPGNPSLAEEIREKILGTFNHTLNLAAEGKREEALLGCDFIRRLDPQFEPATLLQDRVEKESGPVPVDDLRIPEEPADDSDVPLGTDDSSGETLVDDELGGDSPDTVLTGIDALTAALPAADSPSQQASVDTSPEPDPQQEPEDEPFAADALQSPVTDDSALEGETAADDTSLLASALDLSALSEEPEAEEEAASESEPEAGEATDGTEETDGEPAAALDKESEERVGQLLAEGQEAFGQAEYQSAIDAWSRIFLIDIDHPEANRRIELARKLKAEVERKVEETYHDALSAMESGSLEVARERFDAVLKLQPNHLGAQEHIDRLSAGALGSEAEPPELPPLSEIEPPGDASTDTLEDFPSDIPDREFDLAPLPEDDDGGMYEPEQQPSVAPAGRPASRRPVAIIAGLVFVVAIAGTWFLRSNWGRFFPNAGEQVVAPRVPRIDPIVRAQGLHLGGDTSMAISQLRRLPPAHPQYAEAQALIAQWETVLNGEQAEGPSEDQLAERDELIAQAREAFANREFLVAEEYFTLASQVAQLDEGARALQTETLERLDPLRSQIDIFRQGEWAHALRSLWLKHEEDPRNLDVLRLMIDSYFNLAVRDLQRGDPLAATENLNEAASLAGSDSEIQRLQAFAATYGNRPPDLLYRIFVKYLPFR
ncbi:MAG: hypothetical protein OEM62_03130 [Acidobacteriota bacterium]|nr:hypothetical protein [Acidobacteriota bacterium]